VRDSTRAKAIIARYPQARIVEIERYGDVFNAKHQNFKHQKNSPALILARKEGNRVLPTPPGYHIGGIHNYYFSHMLNCVYDCRYCFLQGMYQSANYVVFINVEEFFDDISSIDNEHAEPVWFFSGYDCDSLALDPITGFVDDCLTFFRSQTKAHLELRTKSTQIRPLLKHAAIPIHCSIAMTLSKSMGHFSIVSLRPLRCKRCTRSVWAFSDYRLNFTRNSFACTPMHVCLAHQ